MDEIDRLAAATIVAALITSKSPLLGGSVTLVQIAKLLAECSSAIALERQQRGFDAGSR